MLQAIGLPVIWDHHRAVIHYNFLHGFLSGQGVSFFIYFYVKFQDRPT